MLQIQVIRQNPEWVKERLALKNFTETNLVDQIIGCDIHRRKIQNDVEEKQAEINSISKKIGILLQQGHKQEGELLKGSIPIIKISLEELKKELDKTEGHQEKLLILL